MSAQPKIHFEHRRVGKIELDPDNALHCAGLPGFPHARSFALAQHDGDSPFAWLASLDDADLAFVVAEPGKLFPDYAPALRKQELDAVGAASPADVLLLAIANVTAGDVRMNLAAPILVNATTRRAAQVVLALGLRMTNWEPSRPSV